MSKPLTLNVVKICDTAPPVFMVIDPSRSALKRIGNRIYGGTAGEIYAECSQEEIRSYFAWRTR